MLKICYIVATVLNSQSLIEAGHAYTQNKEPSRTDGQPVPLTHTEEENPVCCD